MSEEKTKDEKPTKFEAKISASDKSIKGERAKVLARKVRRSAGIERAKAGSVGSINVSGQGK